jgi:hypothetical protein
MWLLTASGASLIALGVHFILLRPALTWVVAVALYARRSDVSGPATSRD